MAVIDDFSRECLALAADTSLTGGRVARELVSTIATRGQSLMVVSDNGTEQTSMASLKWTHERGIEWHYFVPGEPQQNGYVESFNGRLRDDLPEPDAVRIAGACSRRAGEVAQRLQPCAAP